MAKAKTPKAGEPLPTWRIMRIAKKGRYLGTVRAADADAAIARAIEASDEKAVIEAAMSLLARALSDLHRIAKAAARGSP